jgi:hypothetical protein
VEQRFSLLVLLESLPQSYDPYLSVLIAMSALLAMPLKPEVYIHDISDEADRQSLYKKAEKGGKKVAFAVSSSKGEKGKKDIKCYNCHKKGHMKVDCWAKGSRKEGQNPKGKGKGKEKKPEANLADADADDI